MSAEQAERLCPTCGAPMLQAGRHGLSNLPTCGTCGASLDQWGKRTVGVVSARPDAPPREPSEQAIDAIVQTYIRIRDGSLPGRMAGSSVVFFAGIPDETLRLLARETASLAYAIDGVSGEPSEQAIQAANIAWHNASHFSSYDGHRFALALKAAYAIDGVRARPDDAERRRLAEWCRKQAQRRRVLGQPTGANRVGEAANFDAIASLLEGALASAPKEE